MKNWYLQPTQPQTSLEWCTWNAYVKLSFKKVLEKSFHSIQPYTKRKYTFSPRETQYIPPRKFSLGKFPHARDASYQDTELRPESKRATVSKLEHTAQFKISKGWSCSCWSFPVSYSSPFKRLKVKKKTAFHLAQVVGRRRRDIASSGHLWGELGETLRRSATAKVATLLPLQTRRFTITSGLR